MPDKLPCELVTWHRFYQQCQLLAWRIIHSGFRPEVIVAIGRGGYMPGRVLADLLGIMDMTGFKIEHYRGAERQSCAVIRYPLCTGLREKRVLLVDDVCDSGETFHLAIEHVRQAGPPAELRTAVLDHKTVSSYQPDFFARRMNQWRWISYPWAVVEDIRGFLAAMESPPATAEAMIDALYRLHGIRLSRKRAEAILALIAEQG